MRKLVTIQRVKNITPIKDADRLECVHVLGWTCVAKKGEFQVGDLCVYFEVDSFLPIEEKFEFLRASSHRSNIRMGEGFLLRTQKIRGQISQGLALPIEFLPEGVVPELGADVTDAFKVRKWEEGAESGKSMGRMPQQIPRTEELRVQSYPELIEELKQAGPYYISTKMDGTSVTMYELNGKFGVCGRNYEYAPDEPCPFWEYAKKHQIEETLRANGISNIALQGEFCGPGIQSNRLKLTCPEWYIFTAIDLATGERYSLEDMKKLCELLGLTMVPIEETGEIFSYQTVEELLQRAKGKYKVGTNKEGIVIRPLKPVYSATISGPLSMKVLNNEYLLKA